MTEARAARRPSRFEVKEAVRETASRDSARADELWTELLKVFFGGDQDLLWRFHDTLVTMWKTGKVSQRWKDETIKVLFKKKDPAAVTPGVSSPLHMLAK